MKIQQITKRTQTKHFIAKLILAVLLIFPSTSQANTSTARSTEMPIVEWTVRDVPDFRWHFLENVKTRKLWHATPEKGTFSHHGFLAYHRGVLFACWDSQARDENVSGQHGVFTYSNNKGETWADPRPLFPPLADKVPMSETKEPKPFQTSQGFTKIDGRLYALAIVDEELKNAGRLPDGQVYVINNPLPMSARQGGRSMLAISLSRDGLNFDRMAVIKFIAPPQRHMGKA